MILLAALLGACSELSRDGPDDATIGASATASVLNAPQGGGAGAPQLEYVLVDLSKVVSDSIGDSRAGTLFGSFGGGRGPAPEIRVGVGDVIQLTVFESEAGGLFVPRDAGSRPGNYVSFPQQTVDRTGFISVPYVGQVAAAGKAPRDIQREVELKLANRAIEPQALLTIVEQRATEVAVLGEVNGPVKAPINPAGDRVLDMISKAGGIKYPGYETYVTLTRAGRRATVFFNTLVENPKENIYLAPGDTIYVYREQRSFLAFGASGLNGFFNFETDRLSWAEAVAKAGGLIDERADPGQVFLYRVVDRAFLDQINADLSKFAPDRRSIPVIFRANLRDPSMYFLAQKFPMADKDVIYVSNANSVELYKFLGLINATSTTVAKVPSDLATAKRSIHYLRTNK